MYIPELPIQVVAVADSTKQDSTELMQALSIQVYLLQYGFETDQYPLDKNRFTAKSLNHVLHYITDNFHKYQDKNHKSW